MAYLEYVYVISGDHGRRKIGVSNDPKARLRELQTGSPFPLRFEFIGLADQGGAYAIEGEAHFMLRDHRQSGEWFTVPSEMAIAAVMGGAGRVGRSIKPVDPDIVLPTSAAIRQPWWLFVVMVPFWGWLVYYTFTTLVPQFETTILAPFVTLLILVGVLRLMQFLVRYVGNLLISLWRGWQDLMHPEGGEKVPLDS